MAKTKIKPRWETWERLCIEKSVEEKIQLKIIALALGKTLNAVSKKMTHMGLRAVSSKPGRQKGRKASPGLKATTFTEIERMKEIISLYAPKENLLKAQRALVKGEWVQKLKHETAFSLQSTPAYTLMKDAVPDKVKKARKAEDPCYVTAKHIQNWAMSKGFCSVGENLIQHGVLYWKEGRHFSKTQMMMHVNQLRLENNLEPIILYEG